MSETHGRKRRALFLDRDGTIIRDAGYPRDPNCVELVADRIPAVLEHQRDGYLIILVSNQSGIGRGLITFGEYEAVQQHTIAELAKVGINVTASYFCPHRPETNCFCRKPRPGMLLLAAHDHDVDLAGSLLMGDKLSDIEAGRAAGCRTIQYSGVAVAGPMSDRMR